MYVLYLDRDHLADPLFLQALAKVLAKEGRSAPPVVLVHGPGELAERRLEGEGYDVRRRGRVLDTGSAAERVLVDQAARELNRKIVGVLTDQMVYAVGFQGTDRGLLRVGEAGAVTVGRVKWMEELARKGAVPVVSALAASAGEPEEVDAAEVAALLASAMQAEVAFVAKNVRAGEGAEQRAVALSDVSDSVFSEPEAVGRVMERGVGAVLLRMPDLFLRPVRVAP